ncbi:MAG: M23 family metallopeptidase [Caulobacteraceae bacterium]
MPARTLLTAAAALGLLTAAAAHAQTASPLEVRFCPGAVARSYPLQDAAKINGLVVHNVAVINRGAADVTVKSVDLQLLDKGQAIDTRHLEGAGLASLAKGGARLQASGMIKAIAFQFCGDKLIGPDAVLSDDAVLKPGEGILIMRQMFAWRGSRDQLAVRVSADAGGAPVEAGAAIPVDGSTSKTVLRFPLKGRWVVVVGATPQGGHRWVIPEEFALDIAAFGADSKSYRGAGTRFTDYYAYGAPVVAAAAGTVVRVHTGEAEDPAALRRTGESLEAYGQRVSEIQNALLQKGIEAIGGDHVMIDHGNGEFTLYAHLKPGSIKVKEGQAVKAGDVVGALGSSGNSTEPHLHFQVCDAPSPLACAGIPPTFAGIELPYADGPRSVQAGDVVVAP